MFNCGDDDGGKRSIILFEGSQALPVRPSYKDSENVKASHLHVTPYLRCERQLNDRIRISKNDSPPPPRFYAKMGSAVDV
jgi:hypothetical protein